MKAVVVEQYGSTEHMKYVDVDLPSFHSTQVLIRVRRTCVNFADIKARHGNKGKGKLPFIPGLEAAGVVEQVGDEVTSVRVGQRVIAFPHNGSYAEYIVADENLTFAISDHMDEDTAGACGIVSLLSYSLLVEIARMKAGESVLIHSAAGGVGTTAIQVARALGAANIIGTVGSVHKLEAAQSAGADYVLHNESEDFIEQVMQLTAGRGVDIILDSVGGKITEESMHYLAPYGRLIVFGNSCGEYGELNTKNFHASCRSVLGYSFGTTRKERPESLREAVAQVFRLFEQGKLEINIGSRYSLQDAALAHELVESRNSTGKVLLVVD
ncbi:NADPH:quinone oxidoreductase family protein [Paenibacillus sp. SC116]|uniref:quinone oxidoreductase family protein n=1 Tax=Paenibacillus sp. SC116 TaxID=2968986 RepID=UPI00215A799B|nr:NADPH:quinone oxidoreductase family protein [Paenibacillus sp. SC116]MCR8845620.1 NADPH:quinone oxidoreductase family protein [Paenibacillus sp. SC116]